MFKILKSSEMDTLSRTLAEVQELRSEISGLREQLGRIVPPDVDVSVEESMGDCPDAASFLAGEEFEDNNLWEASMNLPGDKTADLKQDSGLDCTAATACKEQAAVRDAPEKDSQVGISVVCSDFLGNGLEMEEKLAAAPATEGVCEELPDANETPAGPVKREWAVIRYSSRHNLWWKFWKRTGPY